jgi:TPR repeat protein
LRRASIAAAIVAAGAVAAWATRAYVARRALDEARATCAEQLGQEARLGACRVSCLAGTSAHCTTWGELAAGAANPDLGSVRNAYDVACRGGDPNGCYRLASLLEPGAMGTPDAEQVSSLHERACNSGVAAACGSLARWLESTTATPDTRILAGLDHRACEGGVARSCRVLGARHASGEGAGKDREVANKLFERACELGDGAACFELAEALRREREQDSRLSFLYELGCDRSEPKACLALAKTYRPAHKSYRTPEDRRMPDDVVATRAARTACDAGLGEGCYLLYSRPSGARDASLVERACVGGFAEACRVAAKKRVGGPASDDDKRKATGFLEQGCGLGDLENCLELARFLREGVAGAKNPIRAFSLLRRVCEERGHRTDCLSAARMADAGEGTPPDARLADALYARVGCTRAHCPPTKRPQVRMGSTTVSYRLNPEVVERIAQYGLTKPLWDCYRLALKSAPGLRGLVVFKIVIDRDGAGGSVTDGGSDIADTSVVPCAIRSARQLYFPMADDGIVTVTHPLRLEPGDD